MKNLPVKILVLVALIGCGPNAKQKALVDTLETVNAARAAFMSYDNQHQDQIIADAKKAGSESLGETTLAAYRAKRVKLVEAFESAYYLIATAATKLSDQTLAQAITTATLLYQTYKDLVGADPPKAQ